MDKATNVGTGWVAITEFQSFWNCRISCDDGVGKDMIGWAFTNASPLVSPTFGKERMLGTNPIAVSIPAGKEPPFVADLATTTAANGKLEILQRTGKEAPLAGFKLQMVLQHLILTVSNRAVHYYRLGGDRAHGSHKGYALGAVVDILSLQCCPAQTMVRGLLHLCRSCLSLMIL